MSALVEMSVTERRGGRETCKRDRTEPCMERRAMNEINNYERHSWNLIATSAYLKKNRHS